MPRMRYINNLTQTSVQHTGLSHGGCSFLFGHGTLALRETETSIVQSVLPHTLQEGALQKSFEACFRDTFLRLVLETKDGG
jgi:hypothetical protein